MKTGNLNFLEPSGPLQACNGTALPLPFYMFQYHGANFRRSIALKIDLAIAIAIDLAMHLLQ